MVDVDLDEEAAGFGDDGLGVEQPTGEVKLAPVDSLAPGLNDQVVIQERRRAVVDVEVGGDRRAFDEDQNGAEGIVEHGGNGSAMGEPGRALLPPVEAHRPLDAVAVDAQSKAHAGGVLRSAAEAVRLVGGHGPVGVGPHWFAASQSSVSAMPRCSRVWMRSVASIPDW